MGLTLTVLGCSGSYAAPGGACTGYLIESDTTRVWLDAGPGTLANLQRHTRLEEIDAIVITHEHPDHWLELPVAANALRYFHPRDPVPLYTTAHTAELLVELAAGRDPIPFDIAVIADGEGVEIGDQTWRFSRTHHYVETLAPRIDSGGRSMVFSADTGPEWSMTSLGDGIDLALVESTFIDRADGPDVQHLTAAEAGELAAAAGVGRLVLTHLKPFDDPSDHARAAAATFDGPIDVAAVDATYLV